MNTEENKNPEEGTEKSLWQKIKPHIMRFLGFKTEEELNRVLTREEKIKETIKSFFWAFGFAFIIITFILQNTRIPTPSMESTILVGDFVIVNKFIYGSSSPRYIPLTQIKLPYFTFPAVKKPKAGDVVVFEFPGEKYEFQPNELNVNYVKRLIGVPGDTLEIKDKVVFINGKEFWIPPNIQYSSQGNFEARPYPRGLKNPQIFPEGMPWNEDNYGPLYIPKKGDVIKLSADNITQWKVIINRELERETTELNNGKVYIDGKEVTSYTLKKDYYFMMGDNRGNSWDSRFWGFVPDDHIVGSAMITLFSWDNTIPFSEPFKLLGSIRFERTLKVIH